MIRAVASTPHASAPRNDTTPHPKRAPGGAHRDRVERQVAGLVGRQPAAEVATEQDCPWVGRDARGLGELGDRRPDLDLGDGATGSAPDRDQCGAARRWPAELAIPVVSVSGDEGRLGETLDVLDERRPAVDAALVRPRGRAGRPAVAVVDEVDRGRFLAGDIGRRGRDERDGHVAAGPLSRVALAERAFEGDPGGAMLGPDVQDDPVGADRAGREDRAVEHEMWPGRHQRPVLGAHGLALGAIGQDHGAAGRALGDRRATCVRPGSPRRPAPAGRSRRGCR